MFYGKQTLVFGTFVVVEGFHVGLSFCRSAWFHIAFLSGGESRTEDFHARV